MQEINTLPNHRYFLCVQNLRLSTQMSTKVLNYCHFYFGIFSPHKYNIEVLWLVSLLNTN